MKKPLALMITCILSFTALASPELAERLKNGKSLSCKKNEPSGGGRGKSTKINIDLKSKTMLASRVNVNEGGRFQRLFAERPIEGGRAISISSTGVVTYAPRYTYRDFWTGREKNHCSDNKLVLTPVTGSFKGKRFEAKADYRGCAPTTTNTSDMDYQGYYYDRYFVFVKCKIK